MCLDQPKSRQKSKRLNSGTVREGSVEKFESNKKILNTQKLCVGLDLVELEFIFDYLK